MRLKGDQIATSSSAVFDIDGNESSKDLEFDFAARAAGVGDMTYEYTSNQRPVAMGPVQVTIADSPVGCIPRVEDIAGCWIMQWEGLFGELVLSVGQHGALTGTFDLVNGRDGSRAKGTVGGYISGSNALLVLNSDNSSKAIPHRLEGNLLEVQGTNQIVLCGIVNGGSLKPFITGVLDANATEADICKSANFRAYARSQ